MCLSIRPNGRRGSLTERTTKSARHSRSAGSQITGDWRLKSTGHSRSVRPEIAGDGRLASD